MTTQRLFSSCRRIAAWLSGRIGEGMALLVCRLALGGVFWRSGRTKVEDGSWLQISDTTFYLFDTEYAGVPLPAELAARLATYAEFFLPLLIFAGLATRFAALGLLGMTLVIQVFVYPEAWWATHIVWTALALMLLTRGAGVFSVDALLSRRWALASSTRTAADNPQ